MWVRVWEMVKLEQECGLVVNVVLSDLQCCVPTVSVLIPGQHSVPAAVKG